MTSKVKHINVKEGDSLQISIPKGKLAIFKWDGKRNYDVLLVDI